MKQEEVKSSPSRALAVNFHWSSCFVRWLNLALGPKKYSMFSIENLFEWAIVMRM